MTGCADLTLHLNPKAWAILHLLSEMPPEFANWNEATREYDLKLRTYPWFNGRERGMVLTLQHHFMDDKALHIAFAECRGSDQVFVEVWEDKTSFNAPTVGTCDQDARNVAYRNREEFDHVDDAATYAYEQMEEYYQSSEGK